MTAAAGARRAYRARAVWTGEALLPDGVVEVERGVVVAVRPARRGDPPALDGWILPGLVNAHTHLELSWAAGRVPGGDGLVPWVERLAAARGANPAADAVVAGLAALSAAGTAAVCDVRNGPDTGPAIAAEGLVGIAQHELLGMDLADLPARLRAAAAPPRRWDGPGGAVWSRPAPHGVYSTPPELLAAACAPGPVPATIHVAEDPEELAFVARGGGAFAGLLDRLGRDWSWFAPRGETPIGALDRLGLLGPDLLLVHGVWLTAEDRAAIARAGACLCLCPRSNLHIGGRLPDVPALLDAGVPLALGTDGLGSAPDLDVLGEVEVLVRAFPEVDPLTWLRAATAGGARALRVDAGHIAPGRAPGLLLARGVGAPADFATRPPRAWLERPGAR